MMQFLLKNICFQKAQIVAKYSDYLCKKICHQNHLKWPNLVTLFMTEIAKNVDDRGELSKRIFSLLEIGGGAPIFC